MACVPKYVNLTYIDLMLKIARTRLLLRWRCNVSQVEFSLSLILPFAINSDDIARSQILAYIFLQTLAYGSSFNQFDVVYCLPKATEFREITQACCSWVIQGHRFWYQWKARMRVCE